ncbi:DUF3238 domain-containing protein [Bacillus toyonensis]|uniref:DUF3238 domain-containing protein n=1 Tax=Bacillus toyonensis TaxID=155322 RepID=UPI000BFB1CE5|nr:DUF3238 domain-containing protein [Bacillus toyonensis]PHA71138.1 hypothetical protein COE72_19270 [Bacillus toyonensis]
MKKLFSFLLFVFVIFSANNISFADEVIPFNKSFFAYNEPSFTSAKGNGGAQYGPQKALTVKEKRSDGWWKIGTWEGDKWINTDGEKKKIEKPYITFAEPKFTSPKGNNGNVIAPQVVTVIDGQEDGWLKIQTNEGDKWIFLNSEAVKVDKNFYAYNEPSFTSEKASGGNQYGPQKSLVVKEKRTNGWWKVATYEGDKWVNLDGELKAFDKPFLVFYEPAFASQKGNMEVPYSPTTIRVIEGNTKGWLKVQTWEGDKWMYPGVAETVAVNKNFYVYNEPSFTSAKGSIYGPQKFLAVMEKRQDGWWKIVTANEGLKWVALNGAKMDISNNLYYAYNEPSYSSDFANGGMPYGPQTVKVLEEIPNGWMKIATWEGDKWINLIGEKVCKKINPNVQRAAISKAALDDNEKQLNTNGENVDVVSSPDSIQLSWNKRDSVANYKLQKLNDDDQWEDIWNGTDTKFTVSGLESSNSYALKLISYDKQENILNESKINAVTLKTKEDKQQVQKALLSPEKVNASTKAANDRNTLYPMTDAYINTVESGGMVKVTWGNVPTDGNSYDVYKNDQYVTTTNKNEFIEPQRSVVQKAALNKADNISSKDDPYRNYYDVKGFKSVPSENVEEKVASLKASGITPTEYQKEDLGCEEKEVSTYVDKPGWSTMQKFNQSPSNYMAADTFGFGYLFRYQTFIPMAQAEGPLGSGYKYFEGDIRRRFSFFSDQYRTRLDVKVTWKMKTGGAWAGTPAEFSSYKDTGWTHGVDNNNVPRKAKANPNTDLNYNVISATPTQANFIMRVASANPLVTGAPDIDAFVAVSLNRNGSGAAVGFHDRAPNHEFYKALYSEVKPRFDNVETLHTATLHPVLKFWALVPRVSSVEFVSVYPRNTVN